MALPGGPALHMGDDNFPAPVGKLRLIAKTDKKFYAVDSDGNEVPLEGIPSGYVLSATIQLTAGEFDVTFATPLAGASAYRAMAIGLDTDEVVNIWNKTGTGFKVKSSVGSSTIFCDVWMTLQPTMQ